MKNRFFVGKSAAIAGILLVLVAGVSLAQHDWSEVFQSAERIQMESWGGIGTGEVAEGFASFAIDLDYTGPLTLEVVVTEVRPGASYEDDDSMLFLFDSRGNLLAENDDSELGGAASLINGYGIDEPGRYYAVVTTYSNRVQTDSRGAFVNLGDEGGSNISFELVVEYGMREGDGFGEYGEESYATTVWFEDFGSVAEPIRYDGGEITRSGVVSTGVEVYEVSVGSPQSFSADLRARDDGYGDTVIFVIDTAGNVVAEDDDGGMNGGSLVPDVYLEPGDEYFVVVTTFPNWPNYNDFGYVEGFGEGGEDFVEYELTIGPPQEYVYEDPYYGNFETEFFLTDFPELATEIRYTGEEFYYTGFVSDGVALYRLIIEEPTVIGAEVYEANGNYGDTKLFLIDSEGFVLAEDDDGGRDGGSLIPEYNLDPGLDYYLAVTAFPNSPTYDDSGLVEGFPQSDAEAIEFELVVGGPREYYAYEDPGFGMETAIWFDEFPAVAVPVRFNGEEQRFEGFLSADPLTAAGIYAVTVGGNQSVSMSAVALSGSHTDLIMAVTDDDGFIIGEYDDGAGNGGSLVRDLFLEQGETYYVGIAAYPNWPNRDMEGYVEGFPVSDGSYIEYVFTIGPPQDVSYFDETYGEPYPDNGVPAYSFAEIVENARFLPVISGDGVGSGEVGTGYSAFEMRIDRPLYLSMEVVVTEVRQGTEYSDTDSMLSLFDSEGMWYASDDDGGMDYASKLDDIWIDTPGTYYAIVTTHPNDPETSMGYFDYIDLTGASNIAFDLVVRTDIAAQ